MGKLAGRVAVVTGGGSGIGRAIARAFAAEGARVAVADLNRTGAERVAAEIQADGGAAIAVPTDVADSAQVDALFARVVREWGTVDVLSNNAGIGELSPMLRQMVLLRTPLGRSGVPEDIAAVALFLVSDEASFVTGQVVSPNGGLYT